MVYLLSQDTQHTYLTSSLVLIFYEIFHDIFKPKISRNFTTLVVWLLDVKERVM